MSRATPAERGHFIAAVQREFPEDARVPQWCERIMRHGATHGRLAEAMCNGDWPCDNGERETKACPLCGMGYAPWSFRRGACPNCRCESLIRKLCTEQSVTPDFGGDPRGATVKLKMPSGQTNDWGQSGICVPTS